MQNESGRFRLDSPETERRHAREAHELEARGLAPDSVTYVQSDPSYDNPEQALPEEVRAAIAAIDPGFVAKKFEELDQGTQQ